MMLALQRNCSRNLDPLAQQQDLDTAMGFQLGFLAHAELRVPL